MFDERSLPESYENQAFDDKNLPSVITMPDTALDNLPKVGNPESEIYWRLFTTDNSKNSEFLDFHRLIS